MEAILVSWNEKRGFGVLQGKSRFAERYYLHISRIEEPSDTKIHTGLRFEFDTVPPKLEGQLPQAVNVKIAGAKSEGVQS